MVSDSPTLSVLVTDDLPADQEMARCILQADDRFELRFASSGEEALAEVSRSRPDMVVTDLNLPKMNGVELTRRITSFSDPVPVVLMTAFGSEVLAIDAIRAGATSYVPKNHLQERLLPTVLDVAERFAENKAKDNLFSYLNNANLEFSIPAAPESIPPLVDHIQDVIRGVGYGTSESAIRCGLGIEEVLHNALYWGCLELSPDQVEKFGVDSRALLARDALANSNKRDRRIHLRLNVDQDSVKVTIRHEGRGIPSSYRQAITEPGGLDSGGGLWIMCLMFDSVEFDTTGHEVILTANAELKDRFEMPQHADESSSALRQT